MIASWQAVRTGRLAANCALGAALLCALVSVVVSLSAVLDGGSGGSSPTTVGGPQSPLIAASACETERARSILASTAERDVRWRGGDELLRWGEWRVTAGAVAMPIRVLVVVVNPKLAEWAVSSASNVAGDRWTLADAAEDARLAVGISAPLQAAPDSGAGLSGALDVLTAVPAPAHLFAEDGSIAPRACGPRTPPEHLTRERRVALGVRDDGAALFVLAHFDGVGEAAAGAPLGTTVPELASIMHALGVRRGAMLATGAAAQLLVRPGTDAGARRWPGDAGTPVGLTLRGQPRTPHLNAGDLVSRP